MSRQESILKLRDNLVRRREALQRALQGDLSMLQELHQQKTGDVLDAAADTVQDELNCQLVEVESRELAAIDEAIARMETGDFGNCEACEKPIPIVRLRAIPYATDCIECRRKAETTNTNGVSSVTWNRVFDNVELDNV